MVVITTQKKIKLSLPLIVFLCMLLVISPIPTQAISYSTTTYDFYGTGSLANTNDNEITQISGTIDYGIWQPCDDTLNGSHYTDDPLTKWVVGGSGTPPLYYGHHANTTTVYQGNASACLTNNGTSVSTHVYKKYRVGDSFDPHNMWIAQAILLEESATNEFGHVAIQVQDDLGSALGQVDYFVYNNSASHSDAGSSDRVRIGNNTNEWYYFSRNVTSELVDSGGAELTSAHLDDIYYVEITFYLSGTSNTLRGFFDSFLLIGHEDVNYPEPSHDVGDPITLYGPEGLNLTSDADDRTHIRCDFDDFSNLDDYSKRIVYTGTPTGTPHLSSSLNVDDAGYTLWNRTIAQLTNNTWNVYSTIESYIGDNIDGQYADMNAFESEAILIFSLSFRTTTEDANGGNGDGNGGDGDGDGDTGDGGGGGGGNGGDGGEVSESLKMVIETDKKNYHWGDLIYVDVYLIYAKSVSSEYVKIAFDSYDLGYAEKIGDKHYQAIIDSTIYVQTYGEHVIYVEADTNVHDKVTDSVTVNVVQFVGPTQAIENFLYAGGSLITIIRVVFLGGIALISLVFGKFINTYIRAFVVAVVALINGFFGWVAYYLQAEFWPTFLTFGDFVSNFMWFFGLIVFAITMYTILKRRREEKHSGILT